MSIICMYLIFLINKKKRKKKEKKATFHSEQGSLRLWMRGNQENPSEIVLPSPLNRNAIF